LTLRIGRQNLNYGENFLVSDGTPGDGSRTIYFNAAKFSFKAKDFTVDLIGHLGTEYDQYLPVFNQNDPKTRLNLQNEKAVMLFGKSNLSERFYIEPYYIFKSENNKIYEQLNTFGSYVKYNSDTLTVRGQLASQIREKQSNSANAFAGYAFIDKQKILFNDKIRLDTYIFPEISRILPEMKLERSFRQRNVYKFRFARHIIYPGNRRLRLLDKFTNV
jgi:hypothetical protein